MLQLTTEFKDFDQGIPTKLFRKLGFVDMSWNQDTCPRFVKPQGSMQELLDKGEQYGDVCLSIDYKSTALREYGDSESQIVIYLYGNEGTNDMFDSMEDCIAYLKEMYA